MLAYLYNCFTEATIDNHFSESFDGTLLEDNPTKFDFKDCNWLKLFNSLVISCEQFVKSKSNYNLERMRLSKAMLVNYWAQLDVHQPVQPKKRNARKDGRKKTKQKNLDLVFMYNINDS